MSQPATIIDLRSDTVTRPSVGMRHAMAEAEVGDDQYGEDPSVNRLQEYVAALLGKQGALWFPTGTMANQAALLTLTRPGDDVVVSRECHAVWHETGAGAANAGVQFTEIGAVGVFSVDEFAAVIKPRGHMLYPPTTLVQIENTHNRAGGVVVPQDDIETICALAREHGISSFLDGARLWNAAETSRLSMQQLAQPFDLVSVALSKGLGAPAGSVLAGSATVIADARRQRRRLGGAMRQAGILAAAGQYAIEHQRESLAVDHENAWHIATHLARSPHISLALDRVQTNIVVFQLRESTDDAATVARRAATEGLLLSAFGPRTLRLVTHRDVSSEQCARAAALLCELLEGRA